MASLSVGYATLTHGYILADARLASCPDAFAPRHCECRSRTHRIARFALCMGAWALRYRYCDNHAAANVRWGRDPGGECRRDLARGERSVTPGHQRTPPENASVQDANCPFHLGLQPLCDCVSAAIVPWAYCHTPLQAKPSDNGVTRLCREFPSDIINIMPIACYLGNNN